ncbi:MULTISPECIES: hypothetical protein [unclassified Nocardioides]|uniref:hypothetical protein n=1 Tax=unclassified Nocardioides TaxID=2615069 RepID=UPI0006FC16B0|nr:MULTISPECIES: hypothetical protein [unclassified Nocardioides]KQY64185.1 hypothetical protein ASD30_04295 [Nocardioides sp. Root140]KRF16202.1 hypothetical protein ASH02_06320 [Nocardioides sp. Soil796]
MSLSTEAHLAIAGAGLAVGIGGVLLARRAPRHVGPVLLHFLGFGTFAGASLNAMDSARLSDRAQGLWLYGFVAVVAWAVLFLARHSEPNRGTRAAVLAIAALMTVSFACLLLWDFDLGRWLPNRVGIGSD